MKIAFGKWRRLIDELGLYQGELRRLTKFILFFFSFGQIANLTSGMAKYYNLESTCALPI